MDSVSLNISLFLVVSGILGVGGEPPPMDGRVLCGNVKNMEEL